MVAVAKQNLTEMTSMNGFVYKNKLWAIFDSLTPNRGKQLLPIKYIFPMYPVLEFAKFP